VTPTVVAVNRLGHPARWHHRRHQPQRVATFPKRSTNQPRPTLFLWGTRSRCLLECHLEGALLACCPSSTVCCWLVVLPLQCLAGVLPFLHNFIVCKCIAGLLSSLHITSVCKLAFVGLLLALHVTIICGALLGCCPLCLSRSFAHAMRVAADRPAHNLFAVAKGVAAPYLFSPRESIMPLPRHDRGHPLGIPMCVGNFFVDVFEVGCLCQITNSPHYPRPTP
jgi:hypothetical protein